MSQPVLDLRRVRKTFQRGGLRRREAPVVAVDDVSLLLAPGEIVGLVGASGAGKSTVGRMILGLERPDSGEVRFEGVDVACLPERKLRRVRRRMHLVLQDPYESLHPGMRVGATVAEPLVIAGVDEQERSRRAATALEEVGLVPASSFVGRFPHELSGGQRQRVAVARALVVRPRVAVADEPTSMLDASVRAGILELILGMRDRFGTAFLFVTHDLAVARYVSDRLAVMHDGRLVESGETDAVIEHPQQDYTRALLAASEGIL
ncbi:MAG: ATP-binding cassette domain-containing protein [Actinomycetota bacterium]|nr:ATP-binding cassette domain-containing protein [Actinomycetota bacterium]